MPNPDQPRPEGRFENAKMAALAGYAGACFAPIAEIVLGSQALMEHMPLYGALGIGSALGFAALEAADLIMGPKDLSDSSQ